MRTLMGLALFALASAVSAQPAPIALSSGQTRTLGMPAGSLNEQFVIDTSDVDQVLRLNVDANEEVLLLARFGSPFQFDRAQVANADYLLEQAHYRSIADEISQRLVITRATWQPVRQGRWYLLLLNLQSDAATVNVTATASSTAPTSAPITLVLDDPAAECGTSGWNDAGARAPVGGNSGSTLGEQRRLAIAEAVRLLQSELRTKAPLRIQACFQSFPGGSAVSATLASAGPRFVVRNTPEFRLNSQGQQIAPWVARQPWLTRAHTWYPGSSAAKLAGTAFCAYARADCGAYDIRINVNQDIDGGTLLGGRRFYYGFSPSAPGMPGTQPSDIDFVATMMHELGHGLGFISLLNLRSADSAGNPLEIGAKLQGFDDVYSARLLRVDETTNAITPLMGMTNAQRAAAMTAPFELRWDDLGVALSAGSPGSAFNFPQNLATLFSPNPIQTGSSVSHLFTARPGFGMMRPAGDGAVRTLGLALPMLEGIGWSDAARPAPPRIRPRHTQYVDTRRAGASLNFGYFGTNASGIDIYYAYLFTYGADGSSEWYLSAGPMIDGVYMPADNANGDSLPRAQVNFVAGTTTPNPNVRGEIRVDFNQPWNHPACQGHADQSRAKAVMAWTLGADRNLAWCLTETVPGLVAPARDLTGVWGSFGNLPDGRPDFGWGLDLLSFRAGSNDGLFGLLYYADAGGQPRWAVMQTDNYQPGGEYPLFDRLSTCRTCAPLASEPQVQIGTIRLDLREPLQGAASAAAGNRIRFEVTYPRAPGGVYARDMPAILQSSTTRPTP